VFIEQARIFEISVLKYATVVAYNITTKRWACNHTLANCADEHRP
jgi:hypothetical protein